MMTLEEIKEALAGHVVENVSEATKIHRNTISNIRTGRNENPTYYVMRKLSEYLSGNGVG